MSLTTNVRNRLLDAINVTFDAVGMDVHTKMPRSKARDNKSPVAWEYFIASHILTRARARLEAAKKAAILAGVIFDHEKHPREPGTSEPIFSGEHVTVWLTVRQPSTRVNADLMSAHLIDKGGVDPKLVADAYAFATTKTRPAHEFKVSLVASEPSGK